jgi:holo-[acyl-carrier protein] synthase
MKREMINKPTIGVDIVDTDRFKSILQSEKLFNKIFPSEEQSYILSSSNEKVRLDRAGARFAAKEAFYKAMPDLQSPSMLDVFISHDDKGRPFLSFKGNLKNIIDESNFVFDVSISHDKNIAIATVIAYKND